MDNLLIDSFVKMIARNVITIEQLPDKYIDAVSEAINNPRLEEILEEVIPLENNKRGAMNLPKIQECELNTIMMQTNIGSTGLFRVDEIFIDAVLGDNPKPTNMVYSIRRVENMFRRFVDIPDVELTTYDDGFGINIKGVPLNPTPGCNLLRVDVLIQSDNYEDMILSIYFVANK